MFAVLSWKYILSLLLIFTAIAFTLLGVYTLLADSKSQSRRKYLRAVASLTTWSLAYAFMLMSGDEHVARLFWTAGVISGSLFFPSWIHFLMHIVDDRAKESKLPLLLYVGSVAVSLPVILSERVTFYATRLGFLYFYGIYPPYIILALYTFMLYLLIARYNIKWWRTSRTQHQKSQLFRFILLTVAIAPPGFFIEYIAPILRNVETPPLAPVLILAVSIYLAIIMKSYSSMSVSVKNASEEMFKSIPMPILLLDHDNKVIHQNDIAQTVWGADAAGKDAGELFLVADMPPDASFFDSDFVDVAVTTKTEAETKKYSMLHKLLRNKQGFAYSKIAAFNDMTDILSALSRAEESSKAKSDFLSRMSHEIRTPMNAIIGMTHICRNTEDTDKKDYCLERIDEASKHLLRLINDILDMSKIEANKIEIKENIFILRDMIVQINDIVAVNAEEKNHELTTEIDENIPEKLIGDELRLAQVITNFLSNAIKFTPEGGKIKLKATLISHPKKDDKTIKFEVIDNGIGLNPEHYEKIFSSFEQADGSIDRQYGGTGLGLSISKNIIELMGGSIDVESVKGGGSCFYFTVTLHTPDYLAATEAENCGEVCKLDTPGSFRGKVILLVDDMEINREIVTAMLGVTSITFDHAENGKEAVEKFKNAPKKYDLIFMDIQMPIMDGLEATRQIRAVKTEEAAKIPIIAMTANALSQDIENCVAAGMNDHIGKPLNFDEVCKKLRTYLR